MNICWSITRSEHSKYLLACLIAFSFINLSFSSSATIRPETFDSVPASWSYESPHYTTLPSEDDWWKGFDDPVLTELISLGEQNSFDLSMAERRIKMAQLTLSQTLSGYYPTIGLSAGYNASRSSGALQRPVTSGNNSSFFDIGLNFSWEIDLFARIREQAKGDKAQYRASKAEYTAAMVSLCSNIAQAYINLRLAQARIDVARRQIAIQERSCAIAKARYETGLASKLDVAQSLTVLYTTQAGLPGLENNETSAINAIALLIGCYPEKISELLRRPHEQLNPFRLIRIGVPSDLIRRRPDILQAEYQLAAYAAQAGIAKKDFLPTLTLSGSIGTSAHNAQDLFSKNSLTYSIAPTLSWTVFEGMARSRRVAYAKEQMLSGIDNYNLIVMSAVIETEDALGAYETALQQISLIKKVCDESEEYFNLAFDRYKRGLSAFTDVMNALVNLLDNENSLIQTKASALSSLIKVYAAVAGSPEIK